jgi:hypothetical protein
MAKASWYSTLSEAKKKAKGRPVFTLATKSYGIYVVSGFFAGEPPAYIKREVDRGKAILKLNVKAK